MDIDYQQRNSQNMQALISYAGTGRLGRGHLAGAVAVGEGRAEPAARGWEGFGGDRAVRRSAAELPC
jgi:hypothetical protein